MKTETEKRFNAPWQKSFQDWESYKEITIYDSKNQPVCLTRNKEMSNRLARLPELYDSLLDAVNDACGACAMMHIQDGYDFVTNGCPFEENEDCKCLKWISVLRKVRNAE